MVSFSVAQITLNALTLIMVDKDILISFAFILIFHTFAYQTDVRCMRAEGRRKMYDVRWMKEDV